MPSIVSNDELARLASSTTSTSSPRHTTRIVACLTASPCHSLSPATPAFSSPTQGKALSPPPPAHYLRNKRSDYPEEKLDLIRKRSEIYTRVKRLSPAAVNGSAGWPIGDDVDEGLLFGKEFHSHWDRFKHSEPEGEHKLILDLRDEPDTKRTSSPCPSHHSGVSPTSEESEDPVMLSVQSTHVARQPRLPLKLMLRERLSISTRSKSVDSSYYATSDSSSQNDSKGLQKSNSSIRTFSSSSSTTPDSPVSQFNAYQEGIYVDVKRRRNQPTPPSTKPLPAIPGMLPTPPSSWTSHHNQVNNNNSNTTPPQSPPPSTALLLDAQKLRRARAIDQFTRYSDALPYKRPNTPQSAREFAAPSTGSDAGCGVGPDLWPLRRTSSIPYGVENVRRRSASTSVTADFSAQVSPPPATAPSDVGNMCGDGGQSLLSQGFNNNPRSSWLSPSSLSPSRLNPCHIGDVAKPTHRKTRTMCAGLKSFLSSKSSSSSSS